MIIFDAFQNQKQQPAEHRQFEIERRFFDVILFKFMHGDCHKKTAGQQENGVDRTKGSIELQSGMMKQFGLFIPVINDSRQCHPEGDEFQKYNNPHQDSSRRIVDVFVINFKRIHFLNVFITLFYVAAIL